MSAVPLPLCVMLHILKNKNILTLLIMINDESFDEIDKKKNHLQSLLRISIWFTNSLKYSKTWDNKLKYAA